MKIQSMILPLAIMLLCACSEHKTTPEAGQINATASLPESFNFSKAGLKTICVTVNKKYGSTSILYGNDSAKATAQAGDGKCLPGAVFELITWQQQDDQRWIGGKIPGQLLSVEMLKATSGTLPGIATYSRFKGADLKADQDTTGQTSRTKFILGLKPTVTF